MEKLTQEQIYDRMDSLLKIIVEKINTTCANRKVGNDRDGGIGKDPRHFFELNQYEIYKYGTLTKKDIELLRKYYKA